MKEFTQDNPIVKAPGQIFSGNVADAGGQWPLFVSGLCPLIPFLPNVMTGHTALDEEHRCMFKSDSVNLALRVYCPPAFA